MEAWRSQICSDRFVRPRLANSKRHHTFPIPNIQHPSKPEQTITSRCVTPLTFHFPAQNPSRPSRVQSAETTRGRTRLSTSRSPQTNLNNPKRESQDGQAAPRAHPWHRLTPSTSPGGLRDDLVLVAACNRIAHLCRSHSVQRPCFVRPIQGRLCCSPPSHTSAQPGILRKASIAGEDDIIEQPPTRQEAAEDNLAYTRALIAFFSFLHTWEHDGHARLTITLQTVTRLPADDDDDFERCGCGSCASQNHEGRLSAAMESLPAVGLNRKALHKSGGLATVPLVCSFTAGFSSGRHLDPAAIPLVARALPNARELRWAFAPSDRRLQGRRRAERLSFANALSSLAAADLRLLTTLTIHCVDEDPSNEGFNPASLVDRASGRDQLSVAFRHISQLPWLRRLCLTGCHVVGSEMFEDPDSSIADNVSTWPTLTYLELGISMITPDGQWYFSGDVSAADTFYYADYDSDASEAP